MNNNEKPSVVIVDENDEIIGYKKRGTLSQNDIYRVSALWITNRKGECLLARRAYTKSHDPGKWGPAVAGTIDEGETYLENIKKETEEKLGLTGTKFKEGPKIKVEGEYNHFTQWYIANVDKEISEFKIQEDEVAEIKWFAKEELFDELKNNPENFIPFFEDRVKQIFFHI